MNTNRGFHLEQKLLLDVSAFSVLANVAYIDRQPEFGYKALFPQ